MDERMLKYFNYLHLPQDLQTTSGAFQSLAIFVCENLKPGPERTVALRKLLEAKDAAVRQKLEDLGRL